jgi:uncharacterized protein (TIGR01777 family)
MRVLVTGSNGLIGGALMKALRSRGDDVFRLVRDASSGRDCIAWDPEKGVIDAAKLEGADALVHLAGENIAGGRWTQALKKRILQSRVQGTALIAETLARLERRPKVLVSASAVGYYGNSGYTVVDEHSPCGHTFLSEVCVAWEAAAEPARAAGIRVVHPRFGVVLSRSGGALGRMLPVFRAGLGGRLGNGAAWMSWVTLNDAVSALSMLLNEGGPSGPVNIVAPNPVSNAEFTRALGRALRRPAVLPVPEMAIRLLFGEMGRELLLASVRAKPACLEQWGFRFARPEIGGALVSVLQTKGEG